MQGTRTVFFFCFASLLRHQRARIFAGREVERGHIYDTRGLRLASSYLVSVRNISEKVAR